MSSKAEADGESEHFDSFLDKPFLDPLQSKQFIL